MAKKSKKSAARERPVKPHKRKKLPRPRALPGLEHIRIDALDDLCHEIAENLVTVNESRSNVENLRKTAKRLMKSHNKEVWTSSGVTITYVHGEDDVRVRLTSKAKETDAKPEKKGNPSPEAFAADILRRHRENPSERDEDGDGDEREPELHAAGEGEEL